MVRWKSTIPGSTLYLKNVHGIESSMAMSNDQIIARVFRAGRV